MGLKRGALVYFDTNVVIRLLEREDADVRAALEALQTVGGVVVTSELTLAEALVGPIEEADKAMIDIYETFLSTGEGVLVVPVDRDILRRAAALRAQFKGAKTPDAIHVASALVVKCDVLVTGDLRLKAPEGLRVIRAEEFAEWSVTP